MSTPSTLSTTVRLAGAVGQWTQTRRRALAWFASGTVAGATACTSRSRDNGRGDDLAMVRRDGRALGTTVSIAALHADPAAGERALVAAFDELQTVEQVMSLYRPDSELVQLNQERVLDRPHPYLVSILWAAQEESRRSGGAFDATVQPLWLLYAGAQAAGQLPDPAAIAAALQLVDWRQVHVTPRRIRLLRQGTAVTLNGIAQGFAADRALAALRQHGVRHALVNTGEVGSLGHKSPGRRGEAHEPIRPAAPWVAGIQHPRDTAALLGRVPLQGGCLATSGDYATSFSADYTTNHLFDPRTGRSPQSFASVSVLAPTAMEADALSTAAFVLGLEQGRRLIAATAGAAALFVFKDGTIATTAGFPPLL